MVTGFGTPLLPCASAPDPVSCDTADTADSGGEPAPEPDAVVTLGGWVVTSSGGATAVSTAGRWRSIAVGTWISGVCSCGTCGSSPPL